MRSRGEKSAIELKMDTKIENSIVGRLVKVALSSPASRPFNMRHVKGRAKLKFCKLVIHLIYKVVD